MNQRERYYELSKKENELRARVKDLEGSLPALQAEAETIDGEARRQELLDEKGWKSSRRDADEKQAQAAEAREALRKAKEDVLFLSKERAKFSQAVRDELLQKYHDLYAVALKKLYNKLLAASEGIQALVAIQDEANREAGDIGPVQLTPHGRGNLEFALTQDQIEEFEAPRDANGYAVD